MMLSFICIPDYHILKPFYLLKFNKQLKINEIKQKHTDLIINLHFFLQNILIFYLGLV